MKTEKMTKKEENKLQKNELKGIEPKNMKIERKKR